MLPGKKDITELIDKRQPIEYKMRLSNSKEYTYSKPFNKEELLRRLGCKLYDGVKLIYKNINVTFKFSKL